MKSGDIQTRYATDGYVRLKCVYAEEELREVHQLLQRFHVKWLNDNEAFYQERAINSAYLTGKQYLNERDRLAFFKFIGSTRIAHIVEAALPHEVAFMGSQLFFDPANPELKNYWHRDIQYNGQTGEEQQASLATSNPLHLRIALKPERGVELVPGTHRRWDSREEYDVRMARNGREVHNDLASGVAVGLEPGDVLLFSAAMIHRGLYGGDRFALDLLFSDANPEFARFIDREYLPDPEQLASLEYPALFQSTLRLKSQDTKAP